MISVTGLGVRLGGRPVLAGLDVEVAAGEWLAVIGPNGAGKSTLLRALAGLIGYTGSVRLGGREVGGRSPRTLAREVAVVPQLPVVPPGTTVADYVLLGRTPYHGVLRGPGPGDHAAVADALAALDLDAFARRYLTTMSGGELQRVFLARALAQQPRLLLLDEPTSALDLGHAQEVLGLVDRLRARDGLTVVATLHDLTLAGEYADRLLLLDGGRASAVGPPDEVLTEERIARTYAAEVAVLPPAPGRRGPTVVPVRR